MIEKGERGITAQVFLFFAAGLTVNHFLPNWESGAFVRSHLPLICLAPAVFVFLFSTSVYGAVLIPPSIMLSGYVTGHLSAALLGGFLDSGKPGFRLLLMEAAFVPAFFLLSAQGMSMAGKTFSACRRERGDRELASELGILLTLLVFIGLTVVLAVLR